jgi:hypothetical protein
MKSISPHVPPESQQEWRSWLQWNSGCRAILEWWGLSLPVDSKGLKIAVADAKEILAASSSAVLSSNSRILFITAKGTYSLLPLSEFHGLMPSTSASERVTSAL